MERTLVLIKPDAIQRSLIGEIINRFERKGLKIIGMKMFMGLIFLLLRRMLIRCYILLLKKRLYLLLKSMIFLIFI